MSDQATFIVGLVGTLVISMGMILVANLWGESAAPPEPPAPPKVHKITPQPELRPVDGDYAKKKTCASCVAAGAGWDATESRCVERCSGSHTNCFAVRCPTPCSKASCGTCFNPEQCKGAGCVWNVEEAVSWCTAP